MKDALILLLLFHGVFIKDISTGDREKGVKVSETFKIRKTNAPTENENSRVASDCITTLLHIQRLSFLTTNCCLTKLCSKGAVSKQMIHDDRNTRELLYKLCSEKLYLIKEQLTGCVFKNNLNIRVNKNTNPRNMSSNKENSAIANCSENFQARTINRKAAEINFGIIADSEKGPFKKSSLSSSKFPKSSPYVEAPNSRTEDKEIRFGNITKISARISGLQFLDVPKGDEMRIHDLRLEDEYLLFEAFSSLMGYLLPSEFPAGLLRDALQSQVPFHLLAFQILKMEIPVVGWISMWILLALCLPFIIIAHLCCSGTNIQRLNEDTSDISMDLQDKCREGALGFLLHFLLILAVFPIIFIMIGNEQISRQISKSGMTTNTIFEDLNTFVRNTHMQISFVATSSLDVTIEAIRKDLEDAHDLLGRPFQKDLATETRIDMALDTLNDVRLATAEITMLTTNLLDECTLIEEQESLLQEQLREIARQLTIARQQCRPKDRTVCYTLQITGLDVLFSCGNLTADTQIKHLERIGSDENFNQSIENAHETFDELPDQVYKESVTRITEIKNLLGRKRTELYKSVHSLDELTRSLLDSIMKTQDSSVKIVETINKWEIWRWLSILGICIILFLVWGLLLCGAPCRCGLSSKTMPLLLSGVSFSSLMSLVLCSLGTLTFLLGGHGQSMLCQPLYDQPHYRTLAQVLNSGGILYEEGGFFKTFLKANDSLKVEDVLKNCQRNQSVYKTFHLYNFFDANSLTNYKSWVDYKKIINNFTIEDINMEILNPSLQLNLQVLSTLSEVNLTRYRAKIGGPITKRDLNSFADQLNAVARQLSDIISSKRIDNLALMVRKIIHNEMARLSDLRDRILYKITALEVKLYPLSKQANQSLSHLKTIQYFLDNQRWKIAEKHSIQFTARLQTYLDDLHHHIFTSVTKEIGKCRPLWEIFHAARFCACKLIVDPTNGISVSSFTLILLFLGIVPVVLKLLEHYRELNEELLTSITHRRTRDGLIIDDEGTWATPAMDTPEVEMRNIGQTEQSWLSPSSRQQLESLIPSPPRLSTIASRISAARVPQIPSVSRARSPKRRRNESLRLIEPICWKSG